MNKDLEETDPASEAEKAMTTVSHAQEASHTKSRFITSIV
jgi:hypothetical protein